MCLRCWGEWHAKGSEDPTVLVPVIALMPALELRRLQAGTRLSEAVALRNSVFTPEARSSATRPVRAISRMP